MTENIEASASRYDLMIEEGDELYNNVKYMKDEIKDRFFVDVEKIIIFIKYDPFHIVIKFDNFECIKWKRDNFNTQQSLLVYCDQSNGFLVALGEFYKEESQLELETLFDKINIRLNITSAKPDEGLIKEMQKYAIEKEMEIAEKGFKKYRDMILELQLKKMNLGLKTDLSEISSQSI